jgi:NADH-quinone oxidoreductase E subunit
MTVEFSSEDRDFISSLTSRYPEGRAGAALLPVLHLAQERFGHLDHEVQRLVAGTLQLPPTQVHEVVTFYEMYHEHPEGQFHLEVCTNISCHLCGGDALLDHLEQRLGIRIGQTTGDGLFSLMEAECLASCGSAPMMKVGLDYYEFLTLEAVDHLLEKFQKLAPSLDGKAYKWGPEGPHVGPVPGFEPSLRGVSDEQAAKVNAAHGHVPPVDPATSRVVEAGEKLEKAKAAAETEDDPNLQVARERFDEAKKEKANS